MLDVIDIGRLYEKVLESDMLQYHLKDEQVRFGIECMQHVYRGETTLQTDRSIIADYTDPAHRCAYLHKYASLHTAMVRDMLTEAVNENYNLFRHLVFSGEPFKICSLGGGPGTDVIGALSALHSSFGYFECSSTIVDYMSEWSYSFDSILRELGTGWYGAFGNNISYYLNWRYVGANLLKPFKNEVVEALSTASLVTMVKFTSAAACKDTYSMIRNIFTAMKPGAALLFIDNDGGGFHKLIEDAACEFDFQAVFGPFRRENYLNSYFRRRKFGYSSCFKTTVTVHVLQKQPTYPLYLDNFPSSYLNPYPLPFEPMLQNRPPFEPIPQNRPILSNRLLPLNQPLLASPPTPFLYHGESPDNINSKSPLLPLPSPNTPFSRRQSLNRSSNRLGYECAYDARSQFSQDENICDIPDFVSSPTEEIAQSPGSHKTYRVNSPLNASSRPPIYTPNTQPRGKRARVQGCFPMRISKFRHHVASKFNKVKARARSVFRKRNNYSMSHPIFQI